MYLKKKKEFLHLKWGSFVFFLNPGFLPSNLMLEK